MPDSFSKEFRSRIMSRVHGKNTKPEEKVRKYLFGRGFRYRKNVKKLPGCPDIVLRKYHTVIFVNGCFWHKHDCPHFVWPETNKEYWHKKINGNVERDKRNMEALERSGWNIIVIWECQLKKRFFADTMEKTIENLKSQLVSNKNGDSSFSENDSYSEKVRP